MHGYGGGNRLIDALPARERSDLVEACEVVTFVANQISQEPLMSGQFVYFPIDAVLSVVALLQDGRTCEIGVVGNEGASGVERAFGAEVLRTTFCQVPGTLLRAPTSGFLAAISRRGALNSLIRATEKARFFAAEQMIACNIMHSIEARLARWLLMLADRTNAEDYQITHEFLSFMLGVRRAGVTNAAMALSSAGIISYRRGHVRIVDRARLLSQSCECYRVIADAFDHALSAAAHPTHLHS